MIRSPSFREEKGEARDKEGQKIPPEKGLKDYRYRR
jgi:hypothetical protein